MPLKQIQIAKSKLRIKDAGRKKICFEFDSSEVWGFFTCIMSLHPTKWKLGKMFSGFGYDTETDHDIIFFEKGLKQKRLWNRGEKMHFLGYVFMKFPATWKRKCTLKEKNDRNYGTAEE